MKKIDKLYMWKYGINSCCLMLIICEINDKIVDYFATYIKFLVIKMLWKLMKISWFHMLITYENITYT